MLEFLLSLLACFLIGSIPTSVWAGKLYKNIDIREHGSGNAGATNTFRILGWKAGVVVVVIDLIKGYTSSAYVYLYAANAVQPVFENVVLIQIICGLTAVIGHMFPAFAGFRGGKGALTACGMLYGVEPISITIATSTFILVMIITRYVSLGSILASVVYPLAIFILMKTTNVPLTTTHLIFGAIIGGLIIVKHHQNIKRLLAGNENRISSFKPAKGKINKEQTQA